MSHGALMILVESLPNTSSRTAPSTAVVPAIASAKRYVWSFDKYLSTPWVVTTSSASSSNV